MLTEQALDGAARAIRGESAAAPTTISSQPTDAIETTQSAARESAELRNQLLQLRSDVALQGARLRRIALSFGALSLLAIGGAALWLGTRQAPGGSAAPSETPRTAPMAAVSVSTPIAAPAASAPLAAAPTGAASPDERGSAKAVPKGNDPAAGTAIALDCEKLIDAGEGGEKVDFSILFGVGSAQLPAGSEGTLAGFAQMLRMLPNTCVLIEGYADASGHSTRNVEVSLARARVVAEALSGNGGIESRRLVPRGRGSVPTGDATARDPANRRVVFRLFRQ